MTDGYLLLWEVVIFIFVFMLMFYAMQALDFSKLFKANKTSQIKIIITFVSAGVAFAISFGFGHILELISKLN